MKNTRNATTIGAENTIHFILEIKHQKNKKYGAVACILQKYVITKYQNMQKISVNFIHSFVKLVITIKFLKINLTSIS